MKTKPAVLCLTLGISVVSLSQVGDTERFAERDTARKATGSQQKISQNFANVPLAFELNEGQSDSRARFLSRRGRFAVYLNAEGAVVALQRPHGSDNSEARNRKVSFPERPTTGETGELAVFQMKLLGANQNAEIEGVDELPGKTNYFIGNDPKKWHTNLANYSKVRYRNVFRGVDLYFYGHEQRLEYDFVVAPGSDPSAIQLKFEGAKSLRVDGSGNLVLDLGKEEVRFHKPVLYQPAAEGEVGTNAVDGGFVVRRGNRVSFSLLGYDARRPLTIDPVLSYGTYLGVQGEQIKGVAVDSLGNVYAAWFIEGLVTQKNVYVTKLDATGSTLLYSAYISGTGQDLPYGLVVDSAGGAYVAGSTTSADFPTTAGAFQTRLKASQADASNGFVTKLDPSGSSLSYSTYLGGSTSDLAQGIALDSAKNAYITGYTQSADFPVTAGAFQGLLHGVRDGFVSQLNASGSALLYSSFLGGSGNTFPIGIGVDGLNNIYVAGNTGSTDFPLANALQSTPADIFLTKFSSGGTPAYSTLAYSTYFAKGSGDPFYGVPDNPKTLVVDPNGGAYLAGYTSLTNFPTTSGALQTSVTLNGNDLAGFVTKVNSSGSALNYSTYFGVNVLPSGLAVDTTGQAYVSARFVGSCSPCAAPLPLVNPIASNPPAYSILGQLNATGSSVVFASWFYVSGPLSVDPLGNLYLASVTQEFTPATPGAYQTTGGTTNIHAPGFNDFWIGKISPANGGALGLAPFSYSFDPTQIGQTSNSRPISVNDVGSALLSITGINFSGDFSQGSNSCPASMPGGSNCSITVNFAPAATGARTGSMTIDYNDGAAKTAVVSLTGAGFNQPLFLGGISDFGFVLVGKTSASQTLPVQNRGNTVAVTSIAATGDFQQTNTCGSSIPTGASCNIVLTFAPTAAGPRTGTLTVTADAQGSPYVVSLTGNGVAGGLAVAAPASLTFGTQNVGTTSAPQSVTLTNTGTANINVTGVSPSGEFSQTNNCPIGSTLAPNANCTVTVTFSPKAAGTRTGTISIFDSSPNAPQIVQLTGSAIDWALGLASGAAASQTVTAGQAATYQVSVASTGFVGTVALSCSDPVSKSTCSVNNPSVNFTGSGTVPVSVSVTTTARSGGMAVREDRRIFPSLPGRVWIWLLGVAWACGMARFARRGSRLRVAFGGAAVALILLAGLAGCGGGASSTPSPPPATGTPAGSYTVVVSATVQGTTQNLNLQVVVQ
jgi:Abnormal spindle-like microcephaly-assoc'd, ASPM-SPD-2-Hydin/Beta-propeller repeat